MYVRANVTDGKRRFRSPAQPRAKPRRYADEDLVPRHASMTLYPPTYRGNDPPRKEAEMHSGLSSAALPRLTSIYLPFPSTTLGDLRRSIALENYSTERTPRPEEASPPPESRGTDCTTPANRMSDNATHVDVTADNLEISVRVAQARALARKSARQRALQRLTGVKIIGAFAPSARYRSHLHDERHMPRERERENASRCKICKTQSEVKRCDARFIYEAPAYFDDARR